MFLLKNPPRCPKTDIKVSIIIFLSWTKEELASHLAAAYLTCLQVNCNFNWKLGPLVLLTATLWVGHYVGRAPLGWQKPFLLAHNHCKYFSAFWGNRWHDKIIMKQMGWPVHLSFIITFQSRFLKRDAGNPIINT